MTNPTLETVQLSRHSRSALVNPNSFDPDTNTVDVIWTTGADVLRTDPMGGQYIERLATNPANVRLGRLNAGASFLDSHNSDALGAVIGCVVPDSARMDGTSGIARVQLSKSERAADTVSDIRDGIIRNVSVGYAVHAFERTEATDGSPAIMTATDWEPVEISACSVPADPGAQIRMRSAAGLELNSCTISRTKEESSVTTATNETDTANETTTVVDDTKADDTNKRAKRDDDGGSDDSDSDTGEMSGEADAKRIAADAVTAERKRNTAITTLARDYKIEALGLEHCARGTSEQQFKDIILDALKERSAATSITSTVAVDGLKPAPKNDFEAGQAWARKFKTSK